MTREFSEEDTTLFNELWAGALFDIITAVLKRCADWEGPDQEAMITMIIQQLAEHYGLIESEVEVE